MGLIWGISGHLSDQSSWLFGARLFCKNTKKSGFNDIYNIQFFSGYIFPKWILPLCFSVTPPGRPAARPSCIKTESKWHVFQYFSVQNWIKMTYVPIFLNSKLNQNECFPVFLSSKLNQRFPSFPSSKLDQNVCSNMFIILRFRLDFHIKS